MHIKPEVEFGSILLSIEKPARYLGGEVGSQIKPDADYTIALCFPDLYEIGMSNQAMSILYNDLNSLEGIRCERVFAPASDFEQLLREKNVSLYTLETGIPIKSTDILAFTIGYELLLTNIFTILSSSNIPIYKKDRQDGPIVIAGGPSVSNPYPYSLFIDAFFIGEAEATFYDIIESLKTAKIKGAQRKQLIQILESSPSIWVPGKIVTKTVFNGFSTKEYNLHFLTPSIKPVQNHGTVEIMRGCPNGCRFCHAGFFYRPMRMKTFSAIDKEIERCVEKGGYREITLTSLSSGDFIEIDELIKFLNEKWKKKKISFQLPSLKVSSFNLNLLDSLSETRKSGLTFAIETPEDAWQLIINKEVFYEKILKITLDAQKKGWRLAKFYFMIGLPVTVNSLDESKAIVAFIKKLYFDTHIAMNVNIGIFVPKPHTPFQWVKQIDQEEAIKNLAYIKSELNIRNIKISFHSPLLSVIEGLYSRGDERVGELAFSAWKKGARFDAWKEYFNRDVWNDVLSSIESKYLINEILDEKPITNSLFWDSISIGTSKDFLLSEFQNSQKEKLTSPCAKICTNKCGICNSENKIVSNTTQPQSDFIEIVPLKEDSDEPVSKIRKRVLFSFIKTGKSIYLSHLNLVDLFSSAIFRSGIPAIYSEGFNPQIKLEFAAPLALGIEAFNEIGSFLLEPSFLFDTENIKSLINKFLPEGLEIIFVNQFIWPQEKKYPSLASILDATEWQITVQKENFETAIEKIRGNKKINSFSLSETNITVVIPNIQQKSSQPQFILSEIFNCSNVIEYLKLKRIKTYAKAIDLRSIEYNDALKSYL